MPLQLTRRRPPLSITLSHHTITSHITSHITLRIHSHAHRTAHYRVRHGPLQRSHSAPTQLRPHALAAVSSSRAAHCLLSHILPVRIVAAMPVTAAAARKTAAALPKRTSARTAASPAKAAKPSGPTKTSTVVRSKRETLNTTATAATQARKQAAKGKRKRDQLDEEAADSAATAGGGSSHDIYDAEIRWNNKRKDADQKEAEQGEAKGRASDEQDEAETEVADEQYESDDETPAPKAITAKQMKTLEPIVKKTQAAIKVRLQQEEKTHELSKHTAGKQRPSTAQQAQPNKRHTTKQAAQSKAATKPTAKSQQARRQKQEQKESKEVEKDESGTRRLNGMELDEQAEEEGEDENADDGEDSVPTKPPTRTRHIRHSSTAIPSAAELAERGVVYLGHLPHGFFEDQMRAFFSQFGEVTRVQLARNPKTGRSRHFGFVEFAHSSVATLVADAMHRYMMFGHTLVATVVPVDQRHPGLFEKDGMRFRVVPHRRMARVAHNAARSVDEQEKRVSRLLRNDGKKRQQLAKLGVEYDFPGYVSHTITTSI